MSQSVERSSQLKRENVLSAISLTTRLNTSVKGRDYYYKHIHENNKVLLDRYKDTSKLKKGFMLYSDVQKPTLKSRDEAYM